MKKNLFFVFSVLLLCGCVKKSPKKENSNLRATIFYKLFVQGVECKFCARAAIDCLEKFDFVTKADFVCNADDWESGFVRLFVENNNIVLEKISSIKEALQKNDFQLTAISGYFEKDQLKDLGFNMRFKDDLILGILKLKPKGRFNFELIS